MADLKVAGEDGVVELYKDNGDGTYSEVVSIGGSLTKLSTEEKPIAGIQDGWDLLEVDTGKVFVFHNGSWWPL